MVSSDFEKIFQKVENARLLKAKAAGWANLSSYETELIWERFYQEFNFRPSILESAWPSIKEPVPSRTYNWAGIWDEIEDVQSKQRNDLADVYKLAFKALEGKTDYIYALDWQHSCYRFPPEIDLSFLTYQDWLVPPLPNGDYYIFLTSDMTQGFFGHPWEQTICVFGDDVLAVFDDNTPSLFHNLVRANEKTLNP